MGVQDLAQHTLDVSSRALWGLCFGSPAFPLQEVCLTDCGFLCACMCVCIVGGVWLSLCNDTDSLAAHLQPAVGVLCLGTDVDTRASPFTARPVLHGIPPSV